MDYQLVALIGMLVLVAVIGIASNPPRRRRRPGYEYQRVISAVVGGLFLIVAGAIGWDVKYSHGFFQGTKWIDGPVWWELGVGIALLLLARVWARRLPRSA
jgi:hypothetical protein